MDGYISSRDMDISNRDIEINSQLQRNCLDRQAESCHVESIPITLLLHQSLFICTNCQTCGQHGVPLRQACTYPIQSHCQSTTLDPRAQDVFLVSLAPQNCSVRPGRGARVFSERLLAGLKASQST